MKRTVAIAVGGALMAVTVANQIGLMAQEQKGVGPGAAAQAGAGDEPVRASASRGAKSITLPQIAPDLPPGAGREAVNGACIVCHSTRYITMQPRFSRKAWTDEVEKMRKTYGAPIPDAQVPEIVNYLVSIRGTREPATRP